VEAAPSSPLEVSAEELQVPGGLESSGSTSSSTDFQLVEVQWAPMPAQPAWAQQANKQTTYLREVHRHGSHWRLLTESAAHAWRECSFASVQPAAVLGAVLAGRTLCLPWHLS